MNQQDYPENNPPFTPQPSIWQQADSSTIGGGMQAAIGDGNVQIHGDSNVLTFNKTEILQISGEPIKNREFIKTSPYRGLKKFEPQDKDLFFGRDQFLKGLVNELEQTNLILLLGASGSGKSSVVRAGLVPWLSQQQAAGLVPWLSQQQGAQLIHLMFTPDRDPFDSFYVSLRREYKQAEVQIALEAKVDTLTEVMNRLRQKQLDSYWFIFIDQFEELFTTSKADKRDKFIAGLVKLSKTKEHSVKIMATMRADFLNELDRYSELEKVTRKYRPMITAMEPDELRLAIEQPAAHYGVKFETGLVEEIIKDIQGQAGYLPLLQYTLNLLWETEVKTGNLKDRRQLNKSTYRQLGGVRGALQQHIDSIYNNFSEEEKQAAQRIFLKLVNITSNEELGTEWKPVQRRALRSEFSCELEQKVLVKLIDEKLLVSNVQNSHILSSSQSRDLQSIIEIAHETLLTSWTTLNTWIKENRQAISLRNRLYDDLVRWQQKKTEDELWTGSKLERVKELRRDPTFNQVLGGFNKEANEYIDASLALRDRQLRRARIVAGVGLTLAALTATTSILALNQWKRAEIVQEGQINALAGYSNSLIVTNQPFDALIEAIRAAVQTKKQQVKPQTWNLVERVLKQALYRVSEQNRLEGHQSGIWSVSFSPDGKTIASGSFDGTIKFWKSDGTLINTLKGHTDEVWSVSFSPDGNTIASASFDNTVKLWRPYDNAPIRTLIGHKAPVTGVNFSPDSKIIATASWDQTVKLWNLDGTLRKTLPGDKEEFTRVSFSPDGQIIAAASKSKTVKLWNLDGKEIKILTGNDGHKSEVWNLSFSPNGEIIATVGRDRAIKLWNLKNGKLIKTLSGHKYAVNGVSFRPDGQIIATVGGGGIVKLWSREGQELYTLTGHKDVVSSVSFSPDGKTIATASKDRTIRLWKYGGEKIQTLTDDEGLNSVSFHPDGKTIATANFSGIVKLWKHDSTKVLSIPAHDVAIRSVSYSPDGKIFATASDDKTVKLWNLKGQKINTLNGHSKPVYKVTFSPDGKTIATASLDNTVKLWRNNGTLIKTLTGHTDEVWSVSFSPDLQTIATASRDKTAILWSLDGRILRILKHQSALNDVSFSPDGQMIVTALRNNTAKLWNPDGKELQTLVGHDKEVISVSFSHNSQIIATASEDNTVKLWSLDGKELQTLIGHDNAVRSVSFSHDSQTLATASRDRTVILWKLNVEKLINLGGLNLDNLTQNACNWVWDYLKNNQQINESDRRLCDGIRK
ncbi:eIF2A-related protein [Scytonema sp. PCC 10023]|uniref:nSTAND1 domain-containing NTPase n=1 Tax=Scytonema sp. PCC 10023 TaxID=1680591 RepID=UPI0039C70D1F